MSYLTCSVNGFVSSSTVGKYSQDVRGHMANKLAVSFDKSVVFIIS